MGAWFSHLTEQDLKIKAFAPFMYGTCILCNQELKKIDFSRVYQSLTDDVNDSIIETGYPDIQLYVSESKLHITIFDESKNKGLFTKNMILKNTIIMSYENRNIKYINDGVMDLRPIHYMNSTNDDMYLALSMILNSYYELHNANNNINVVYVSTQNGVYLKTLKDIQPNQELYMAYGFIRWIILFNDYITKYNINGFYKFILKYRKSITIDPDIPVLDMIINEISKSPHIDPDYIPSDKVFLQETLESLLSSFKS